MINRQNSGSRLSRLRVIPLRRLVLVCALSLAAACAGLVYEFILLNKAHNAVQITSVASDRQLNIVTRISLNTYYEGENGPSGFEYALLKRFADSLGKELVVHTANTLNDIFNQVNKQHVVLASTGVTPAQSHFEKFAFSEPYLFNQPVVVYKVGHQRPRNYADLVNKDIVVVANSSHALALSSAKIDNPELNWREVDNVDFVELLRRLDTGEIDYTIIDSTEFILHQGAFPQIKRAFNFGPEQSYNWMFANNAAGKHLRNEANKFFKAIQENGLLARLEDQYFGHSLHANQVAANEFAKNINSRLPKYIHNIKQAADASNMDWRLLAAISYQESRWNPKAKSPTGVRGMMMLTRPTAKELGVVNRLDIDESLHGGATYYLQIKSRLPERIQEPDRSWMALAAYNVGPGHLEDARRLTQSQGNDPDSWYDIKQTLPLLRDPKWHSQTRYGYARGNEPVHYVQQVRHYYNVLTWQDIGSIQREDNDEIFVRVNNDSKQIETASSKVSLNSSQDILSGLSSEQLLNEALDNQKDNNSESLSNSKALPKSIESAELSITSELSPEPLTIQPSQTTEL